MNSLLSQQQALIRQIHKKDPNANVTQLLDGILIFLNNNPIEDLQIITSICSEFANFVTLQPFHQSKIMHHQFFIRISYLFRMLLTKTTFAQLTKQEEQCFDAISFFVASLCTFKNRMVTSFFMNNNEHLNPEKKTKVNLLSYGQIFFTEKFIEKYVELLKHICNSKAKSNDYDVKYKVIARLLHIFTKLDDINHVLILEGIIRCIQSEIYGQLYEQPDINQSILTPKQLFFMYECPKYICLRHHKHNDGTAVSICRSMISEFRSDRFQKYLFEQESDYHTAKARVIATYIELLNHFALIPSMRNLFVEKENQREIPIVMTTLVKIINNRQFIKNARINGRPFNGDVSLISYSITLLYNLIFVDKFFADLKSLPVDSSSSSRSSNSIIDICEVLFDMPNRTVEFVARTLAAILEKDKIDEINGPTQIARSYLYMIENTLDDISLTFHGIKLDGILTRLEVIVQNDDVKEEIINDDEGITLIGQCAYRSELDSETIRKPALRIISALSFASDLATEQIKDNDLLLAHIRDLERRSNDQRLIAAQLIWKIEKEAEFISKHEDRPKRRTKQKIVENEWDESKAIYQYVRGDYRFKSTSSKLGHKFDIALSFDQQDRKIADDILKYLQSETDFTISYGKIFPEERAASVESSTVVVLCLSSNYRRSYSCRLEAEYTKKRSKAIIPVTIEGNYEPSGWLNNVIGEEKPLKSYYKELLDKICEIFNEIDNEY